MYTVRGSPHPRYTSCNQVILLNTPCPHTHTSPGWAEAGLGPCPRPGAPCTGKGAGSMLACPAGVRSRDNQCCLRSRGITSRDRCWCLQTRDAVAAWLLPTGAGRSRLRPQHGYSPPGLQIAFFRGSGFPVTAVELYCPLTLSGFQCAHPPPSRGGRRPRRIGDGTPGAAPAGRSPCRRRSWPPAIGGLGPVPKDKKAPSRCACRRRSSTPRAAPPPCAYPAQLGDADPRAARRDDSTAWYRRWAGGLPAPGIVSKISCKHICSALSVFRHGGRRCRALPRASRVTDVGGPPVGGGIT